MKTIIAVIAALSAIPSAAQGLENPTANVSAPAHSGGPIAPAAKAKRYCVVAQDTGTRLSRKLCRTRAEWLAQGYDPLEDVR